MSVCAPKILNVTKKKTALGHLFKIKITHRKTSPQTIAFLKNDSLF